MATTKTIHQSYGNRVGNSFKGVFAGVVVFLVGIVCLFWNEGRTVRTSQDIAYGERNYEEVRDVSSPDPAQEGKFVHFTGKAVTEDRLSDDEFGVSVVGLRLERLVEMYQWVENSKSETKENLGGSSDTTYTYTYKKRWVDSLVDSSEFEEAGHDNPGQMAFESERWQAEEVSVGGFRLPQDAVNRIGGARRLSFDQDYTLPPALASRATVQGGRIYVPARGRKSEVESPKSEVESPKSGVESPKSGVESPDAVGTNAAEAVAEPGLPEDEGPEIGDIRIAFQWVPCHEVSIMAQQVGDTVCAFRAKNGELLYVSDGILTADAMISDAKKANSFFGWLLRLIGFVLLYGGMKQILGPIGTLASVVPFLGRVAGVGTGILAALVAIPVGLVTVAIAWLVYRPLIGIALLVLAVAAFVFFRGKIRRKDPMQA